MNIREITKLELAGEQLAALSAHDLAALRRGNAQIAKARAATEDKAWRHWERAARAFGELGIHFQVYTY